MARKLRIQYAGAVYHVMNRGDRREAIFHDDHDRQCFLETLAEACAKTGWQVHAYCLMPNHFHLVVETPQANLVAGMKWFLGTHTSRFNRWHKLFGHLFSGCYKALIVEGGAVGERGIGATQMVGGRPGREAQDRPVQDAHRAASAVGDDDDVGVARAPSQDGEREHAEEHATISQWPGLTFIPYRRHGSSVGEGTKGDSREFKRRLQPEGQALRRPERSEGRRNAWPSGCASAPIAP